MKKELLIFAVILMLSVFIPKPVFAVGQCCNTTANCGSNETCTGSFSYLCGQTGFNKTCEAATAGNNGSPTYSNLAPTTPPQDPTCGAGNGISTAIGCINFQNPNIFAGEILKWLVGVGSGIAFLLILSAGFTIMSSSGNPERLKAGQELLTSAIAGLILLIFSIFILRFIGIDILGLSIFGFGK